MCEFIKDEYLGFTPIVKATDDIEVEVKSSPTGGGKAQVVIQDRKRQRAWSGEGNNEGEAATEAQKKFLSDPRGASEYIEKKK